MTQPLLAVAHVVIAGWNNPAIALQPTSTRHRMMKI